MKSTKEHLAGGNVAAGMLTLHSVAKGEAKKSISTLTLDKSRHLLAPLAEMINRGELYISHESTAAMRSVFFEMERNFSKTTKDSLCRMYESFGSNLQNFLAVAKVDKRYAAAWKRLIHNLEVATIDLKDELEREVRITNYDGWFHNVAVEALFSPLIVVDVWQKYTRDYSSYEIHGILSMKASFRNAIATLFYGKDYTAPHLTKQLPEDGSVNIDNFEASMPGDVMTLSGLALNASMLSNNGSLSVSAVKRVKKQVEIREFISLPGDWNVDRVEMLCLTYFSMLDRVAGKNEISVKSLVRFAVDSFPSILAGPMFNTFMPAYQGFARAWTSVSYVKYVTDAVRGILLKALDEWMSLDNFRIRLLCSENSSRENYHYLNLFPYDKREKCSLVRKSDKEEASKSNWKVEDIDWFEEIGLKFALHWVKYLCALGIVEVAVKLGMEKNAYDEDPLEGMLYVKLTSLGRYAFGIDEDYVQPAVESLSSVDYDPQNGIITIDEKSPYAVFLTNVAKRISPTRFHISPESLVNGCRRKEELEQRVKNLSAIIDPDREPMLKKMIDEAMSHTDCAEREGGYSLIKLRSDLPGLRQLILTDKEIREMTIMAGPSLAVVKTSRLERFYTICASHGYLMD